MRHFARFRLLLALAVLFTAVSDEPLAFAGGGNNEGNDGIVPAVYRLSDLPVYTPEGKFNPSMMMRLIRESTSPSDWKVNGGSSTFHPYPDNLCVVISTHPRNHDKIKYLLEAIRSERATD